MSNFNFIHRYFFKVIFEDSDGNEHDLRYLLLDSNLSDRWMKLVLKNQEDDQLNLHTIFYNYNYTNTNILREKINNSINKINSYNYPTQLPQFNNLEVLNTDILNFLHEQYEMYGETIDYHTLQPYWNQDLHDNFLILNELIHSHEDANKNTKEIFPSFSALTDFYPQKYFLPIEEKDKLFLKNDFKWGELYLGYNTLGKCWMKISEDSDTDVVERNQVKPQNRFAAEVWFNFGPDNDVGHNALKMERWSDSISFDLKNKIPFNNLNQMVFGRFYLGMLDVKCSYFLNYHNNLNDWLAPRSNIKLKWNNEVFSKFRKIKKIGFELCKY